MKKLMCVFVLGAMLPMAVVTNVAAQTPPPPPNAPPVQGNKLNVVMYVDTVQGAAGIPKPQIGCSQTNLFLRGQQVVFRMWGVNVKLKGVALTPKNVKSVVVTIPGISTPLRMTYGSHGKAPNPVVSFWTAAWKVDAAYPMGVVDFAVVVKTKADKKLHVKAMTARYTQAGFAPSSRLQIT